MASNNYDCNMWPVYVADNSIKKQQKFYSYLNDRFVSFG
jgi:hypothetical protein